MASKKQVAVIGAGTSGLIAIKSLKEEGFEPVCYEKTTRLGGLWHYHEDDAKGVPSVMWSTSLNNSKEPGAISDFPPKPDLPNYMRHFKVLEMFTDYASKFDLLRHIHYNKEVVNVRRAEDYDSTGRWQVVVKDLETEDLTDDVFDAVLVCVGHLSFENIPRFPHMDLYKGKIIHTHSIKKVVGLEGKNVCVVGMGSSGLDAAVETSHVAKQVYLSVRTPSWVITRMGPYGYPLDWTIFNYDHKLFQELLPTSWCSKLVEEIYINPRFSHDLYNIRPKVGAADRDPAVNDDFASRLMNGSLILKKNIKYFTEKGVVFEGEDDNETEVDTVILGTGYLWKFPFLGDEDLVTEGTKVNLYKCVFPPHLKHPTLAVIGFIVPLGPGFPCVEMQCRWATRVLGGNCKLPTQRTMKMDIDRQYINNLKRYGDSDRVYIHVDFILYLDDLASMIGVKPSLLKLLFTDFNLFMKCTFGVFLPYRYRLVGPHRWNGARNAILNAGQRMRAPLQGKRAFENPTSKRTPILYLLCLAALVWYMRKNNLLRYETLITFKQVFWVAKEVILSSCMNR